ncbi:MAG: response regulator [Treponema sp.]|nr:response regulator [Treponema sp.]
MDNKTERKRILIMEDSNIFADMLMEFLSARTFYELKRAEDGFEGIKMVYDFKPHLIITDIEMPLFKGYQVTRFLKSRKNTSSVPVIMFSSLDKTKDKFWGKHAGADMYIEKSPDNFYSLQIAIDEILGSPQDIDFDALEKEGKKINDKSIIEMANNLLDNKLFQTTVIGMLTELSANTSSLTMVSRGIFNLLNNICEAEIAIVMIRSGKSVLHSHTANFAGFSSSTTDDFFRICLSDFYNNFSSFHALTKNREDFYPAGQNDQKIVSYVTFPLSIGGRIFASVHIGNSISEYFSAGIMENIGIFLTAAASILANALSMHEIEELQKNTRIAFARYVPADVMDEIIDESFRDVRQSESKQVTVLCSDIRSFTSISESSEAPQLVDFLNQYFDEMGKAIISEGGYVDKFIGDAIMALFGAISNLENQMVSAVRASVKMLAAINAIDLSKITLPRGHLSHGIGINTGQCVLGNIGFKNKMDYTVIGDPVNLAFRIENITKTYRHPIIVSEYVHDEIKDYFLFRKIDTIRVKGKENPVGMYAVYTGFKDNEPYAPRLGEIGDLPIVPDLLINRKTFADYDSGLRLFNMGEWKAAQEYFEEAIKADENDHLSRHYLKRAIGLSQRASIGG